MVSKIWFVVLFFENRAQFMHNSLERKIYSYVVEHKKVRARACGMAF